MTNQDLFDVARQAVEYLRQSGTHKHFVQHADEVLAAARKSSSGWRCARCKEEFLESGVGRRSSANPALCEYCFREHHVG